jgi:hypothetical protein
MKGATMKAKKKQKGKVKAAKGVPRNLVKLNKAREQAIQALAKVMQLAMPFTDEDAAEQYCYYLVQEAIRRSMKLAEPKTGRRTARKRQRGAAKRKG